ncbi:MAG TPA: 16S rRNA (cytosine(1402)-N(4))-methyltransferase RsmH [Candidatus Binataceae bacterium]|nr:16S rRNA (cytosine(1402)-N(4))-methyltransferase RsmH [Candidatus Binataceae bacterium]
MNEAAHSEGSRAPRIHEPVMAAEVLSLMPAGARRVVDATLGTGGHALALLERNPHASLLGLDWDRQALALAAIRLKSFGARVTLRHGNFAAIAQAVAHSGFALADLIVADLGLSSFALDDPTRGLSFMHDGPLDMRMDESSPLRACDLVNEESEAELARIIFELGEERAARRIAHAIVETRRRRPLESTGELRLLIEGVLGGRRRGGVHPATRTFQALRIAVNRELEALAQFLAAAPDCLAPGGRLVVIAYHSLEDRLVKGRFHQLAREAGYRELSRRVMRPQQEEVERNSRSRSARLRCLERLHEGS